MNKTTRSDHSLIAIIFAKLYYSIPCYKNEKIVAGNSHIKLDEPIDAILWFLDLKDARAPETACPKAILKTMVAHWHQGGSFERDYKELRSKGFIDAEDNKQDGREKDVWLTETGQELLETIRQRRINDIEFMQQELQHLSEVERGTVLRWLNKVADAAWLVINQEKSPAKRPLTKKKSRNTSLNNKKTRKM